jgi:hypothetical protein
VFSEANVDAPKWQRGGEGRDSGRETVEAYRFASWEQKIFMDFFFISAGFENFSPKWSQKDLDDCMWRHWSRVLDHPVHQIDDYNKTEPFNRIVATAIFLHFDWSANVAFPHKTPLGEMSELWCLYKHFEDSSGGKTFRKRSSFFSSL